MELRSVRVSKVTLFEHLPSAWPPVPVICVPCRQ